MLPFLPLAYPLLRHLPALSPSLSQPLPYPSHSPVPDVTITLSDCVDPPTLEETNTRTTDASGIAFFAKTVQYCYGIAKQECTWTVTYKGASVVFTGPMVSST